MDWYRARWEIETFFHVLKNGCRVEALQLARSKSSNARWRSIWWWHGELPA
ncbi:transposase [Mycoavidus sp. HKI]|uniref:transposase n=1 Tax=Mycoavidus sp. HKI TaxID=2840467 RepID=UPI0034D60FAC